MKVDLSGCSNVEQMGLFGLSFEEKVAEFIRKRLKGTASAKKLSDFFQAGGKNVSLVKNLYREYAALMASGYSPSSFTVSPDGKGNGGQYASDTVTLAGKINGKTNIDMVIVLEFLRALFVMARDGKIPFAKWNPRGYQQSTKLQKTFSTEKGLLDITSKTGAYAKIALILGAVGVGAYLLSQLKGLRG